MSHLWSSTHGGLRAQLRSANLHSRTPLSNILGESGKGCQVVRVCLWILWGAWGLAFGVPEAPGDMHHHQPLDPFSFLLRGEVTGLCLGSCLRAWWTLRGMCCGVTQQAQLALTPGLEGEARERKRGSTLLGRSMEGVFCESLHCRVCPTPQLWHPMAHKCWTGSGSREGGVTWTSCWILNFLCLLLPGLSLLDIF